MTDNNQIQIFQSADGNVQLDIKLEQDTLWLTQAQLAELFQVKSQNITMHLKNIFAEQEVEESATCKDFLQVQKEGSRAVKRRLKHYNLDAIISGGIVLIQHVPRSFVFGQPAYSSNTWFRVTPLTKNDCKSRG